MNSGGLATDVNLELMISLEGSDRGIMRFDSHRIVSNSRCDDGQTTS